MLNLLARAHAQRQRCDMLVAMNCGLIVAVLVCACSLGFAQDEKYAPLPEKIVAARTVFLQNDSGEQGFADAVFRQLNNWGRWRIVTTRSEADIVLSLDHKDYFISNNFFIRILDRESGEVLWTAKKDVAIRIWGNLVKKLLSDIEKRLPPQTGK